MSESSSNGTLGIEKLNNENYQSWKFGVEMLLMKEDISETITELPPGNHQQMVSWTRKDKKARGFIGLLVEKGQQSLIRSCTSAKEMWDALKEHHERGSLTNKVMLLRQLITMRLLEDGNMETHLSEMQDKIDKLTARGDTFADNFLVALILSSLPESYMGMVTALEVRPEDQLSMSIVKNTLLNEYRRRQGQAIANEETALKVDKRKMKRECYFCHDEGHRRSDCDKFQRWLEKKNREKKVNKWKNRADAVKATQENSELSSDSDTSVYQESAYLANQVENSSSWVLDSGATRHMTSNIDFFKSLDTKYRSTVRVANQNTSTVYGVGSGEVECVTKAGKKHTLRLDGVLYVPDFESGLISINVLDKEGFKVLVEHGVMTLNKNGVELAVADVQSGMYQLRVAANALKVAVGHTDNCIHTWHHRFGHRDPQAIKKLEAKGLASGIKITPCEIKEFCESCIKGKLTRQPFPKRSRSQTIEPLELVHTDLCGPIPTQTPGGRRYIMTMIDDYSRFTQIFLLKKKSQAGQVIKDFIAFSQTQFNKLPKAFRFDRGGEYIGHELQEYLKEKGINMQLTAPYTPEQNGLAERKNRTLIEAVRTMLIDAQLPDTYWGEAAVTAAYIQNLLPTKSKEKTPHELWFGKIPDVSHLRPFGSRVFGHVPKQNRRKLAAKAHEYVLVGYSKESKAYRLLDRSTGSITISRDVRFIEEGRSGKKQLVKFGLDNGQAIKEEIVLIPPQINDIEESIGRDTLEHSRESLVEMPSAKRPKLSESVEHMDGARAIRINQCEPKSLKEALAGPDAEKWRLAMEEELQSLNKNQTWKLMPLPKGKNAVGCKWVFKIKELSDGRPNRFKARLVAQGFSQKYGIDYDEVFAPVVKHTSFESIVVDCWKKKLLCETF